MAKLVWVLIDGLNYITAQTHMCYLRALTQAQQASFFCSRSLMPPLSRPLYSTFLTGLPPLQHGILRNEDQKPAPQPNIFTTLAAGGISSCIAAYAWFYELLTGRPFNLASCRSWQPANGPLKAASFYASDAYPDAELFADCDTLRQAHDPCFLFAHSMGVDWAGHCNGGESSEYAAAVAHVDDLLAQYIPIWRNAGYDLVICSDHGMGAAGSHYADDKNVLEIPFWLIGGKWTQKNAPSPTRLASIITGFFGLENIPRQNSKPDIPPVQK